MDSDAIRQKAVEAGARAASPHAFNDAVALIDLVASLQAVMEWQDISTAYKDTPPIDRWKGGEHIPGAKWDPNLGLVACADDFGRMPLPAPPAVAKE